ncbi:glycosyltransferase [Nakamurella flavida]|uniref:4,4'-diaponeurosporenoate glycosyltransferase n=1 Tax=Nakamurella flavida TaxID=363630 RepID=A0A938YKS7_9ACTN|nr:glycosyltransferase [Nakamurella flavida]MBM9476366.1 glycosyltransferase [Nakamurella flavida]MDP9779534.1 hypothetical protein [Nakamurella flavida]
MNAPRRNDRRIDVVAVVVPARDEQDRLPGCLLALSAAARAVQALPVAPRVRVLVVQDRCTDGTGRVVASWPEVETVLTSVGRVGGARAAGIARILQTEAAAGVPAERVWIACTDADSLVPATWLHTHLRHARAGDDLLLGMVRLHGDDLSAAAMRDFAARHPARDGHPHVHGANLGVRGDAYRAAGGFPDVAEHEDVLLSRAVRDGGGRVAAVAASPVLTSARLHGRLAGGMSGYLREMVASVEPRWRPSA